MTSQGTNGEDALSIPQYLKEFHILGYIICNNSSRFLFRNKNIILVKISYYPCSWSWSREWGLSLTQGKVALGKDSGCLGLGHVATTWYINDSLLSNLGGVFKPTEQMKVLCVWGFPQVSQFFLYLWKEKLFL